DARSARGDLCHGKQDRSISFSPARVGACSAEPAVGDAAESLFDHKDDLGERRRPSRGEASVRLKGVVNYYEGRDRSKWQSGVPTFGRVRYREIYPGIDLVYHGENGRLEFDFEVAPGASPAEIALALDGAKKITLQADGGIDIDNGTGTIRRQTPVAYQEIGGMHRIVPTRDQVADASPGAKGVKKAA